MAEKRRSFTPEFKQEAVRLLTESGRPLRQVARELGLHAAQLRDWRRELARPSPTAASAPSDAEEVRRLRRELEVVRQERDFLKKAAAFFAKESR
jgi:transposase